MNKITSIEVKCECNIPFHQELVAFLYKLLKGNMTNAQLPYEIPHREAISEAIQRKMLFVKIIFGHPVGRWRHRLVKAIQHILGKHLVGTINGHDGITLILL
ncbi:MAG TPA: hypothetical protein VK623_04950 [Flavobacterium sp.]|nr:hypothetical protein [Flavobacterium sp.]